MRSSARSLFSVSLFACLIALAHSAPRAAAQSTGLNQWTWMNGSNQPPPPGNTSAVYGTLGVPAAANTPGSRQYSMGWTDSNGRLWLFGGDSFNSVVQILTYNDLWRFDTATMQWTWMGGSDKTASFCVDDFDHPLCGMPGRYGTLGIPGTHNWPGGRYGGVSWVDGRGHFWLFGGDGFDANGRFGSLNDLWMFDPVTGEWTWMGGDDTIPYNTNDFNPGVYGMMGVPAAGNYPGSLMFNSQATDANGNSWLFGGWGYNDNGVNGFPNKLWEYQQSSGEWGWMAGPITNSLVFDSSVYGTQGVPDAANTPGSRWSSASWADAKGNIWIFGGGGYDNAGDGGEINELWKFDPSIDQWAWIAGDQSLNCPPGQHGNCGNTGVYGSLGVPAASNIPGGRYLSAQWADKDGNFWLFGGVGFDATAFSYTELNDMWEFNPSSQEWTWVGGPADATSPSGVYGTLGVPSPANLPGSRAASTTWTDKDGNFWLYGGGEVNSSDDSGILSDLWRYVPATSFNSGSFTLSASPAAVAIQAGASGNSTLTSAVQNGFNSAIALSAAGQPAGVTVSFQPASITGAGDSTITIVPAVTAAPGVYPITVTGSSGSLKASTQVTLTITAAAPAIAPTFSPPAGTYAAAQSVSLSDATPGATIYFTVNGATPTMASTVYTGPIVVDATETIQAIATAPGYTTSPVASATYTIPPNFSFTLSPTAITVAAGQSGTSKITQTDIGGFADLVTYSCSGLPAGAACTITPQTVPNPVNISFLTLTISTAAPASTSATGTRPPIFPGASLAVLLCGLCFRKRRRLQAYLLLVIAAVGLSALSGCIIVYTPHSHTNKYNVTVTGTSGALQHSETLGLTVN